MDILDIDEALKDDSYIFLADKTHDDISNILQQWKTNNQEQHQQPLQLQLQHSNDQAYQLNSKTFTRPKRRLQAAANLEKQFSHLSQTQSLTTNSGPMMVSLEIGGLVTNMHKSFLQDTSPPSSICISMNNGCMNNSLISSADFTNLNFLQSINSLEPTKDKDSPEHNLTNIFSEEGYALSDNTRDRKMIESLSMSGDGTLIKDSHIGQIDDISLMTVSKTASGYSTMDNSTDSVSTPNELHLQALPRLSTTMVLSEEMIGDTTFSLVDSLTARTTVETLSEAETISTFKRPTVVHTAVLNETQLLAGRHVNSTFTEGCQTPEAERCDTPENVEMKLAAIQTQSTPLTTGNARSQHNNNKPLAYTPTLKGCGENINISPIVSTSTTHKNPNTLQHLNHTYEPPTTILNDLQFEQANEGFQGHKTVLNKMELLEYIEQPALDATYNTSGEHKQIQCVVDLAKAEVEMLAQQDDEEQFENMLANLGIVNTLNAEQIKIQKSLDSIKRRFHKDDENDSQVEQHQQRQPLNVQPMTPPSSQAQVINSHSHGQSTSGGERLLNRRSRLYDGVNLNAVHDSESNKAGCNSTSFIVHPKEEEPVNIFKACTPPQETEKQDINETKEKQLHDAQYCSSKLTGRRNRDRERFKTIKITKEMRSRDLELENIALPCIDDEEPQHQQLDTVQLQRRQQSPCRRLSRLDQTSSNINDLENNEVIGNNYLTYKKPKEKSFLLHQRQQMFELAYAETGPNTRPQPRSLSRPRYISGLQKATVSKATSAGAGLNTTVTTNLRVVTTEAEPKTSDFEGLKSPMGIKSKSFHNLSSNISGFIGTGGAATAIAPRSSLAGALRRPSVQVSKLSNVFRGTQQHEDETSVFKVPKLVSGLRAPTTASVKRAVGNGLARPSSGYYSLNMKPAGESETPESLSSASSRGSLYGKETNPIDPLDTQAISLKLTQVTTGATGIPKPSGLRQPTQIKRSGLPRPSSIVRR